jgi:hypothetical protein
MKEENHEKITRFNDIIFTKLSHLQYDMLTFNLDKDQIKHLIYKVCTNSHHFPTNYLNDLIVILYHQSQ